MKVFKSLLIISILALNAAIANAVTLTALDYSGAANPGIGMEITDAGIFQTTSGLAQASFLNWASFLPVLDGVGKVRISGVKLTGSAQNLFGTFVQQTTGGLVEALDSANNVLLSATFTDGVISLTSNASSSGTGSQFTVGLATFGGSLASYFVPTSAVHSVSLINWSLVQLNQQVGTNIYSLAESQGMGNGLISGQQVPEPATMLLMGSGALGYIIRRRKVQ